MEFNSNVLELGKYQYSYSKLSVGAACPYRYYTQFIHRKSPSDKIESPAAQIGIAVHTIMEVVFKSLLNIGLDLSRCDEAIDIAYQDLHEKKKYTAYEWEMIESHRNNMRDKILRFMLFAKRNNCHVLVEPELAIDSNFRPANFYANAFFNGKLDLVLLKPNGDLAIIDHKTGKTNLAYTQQLLIYEILAYYALVDKIKSLGLKIETVRTCLNYLDNPQLAWFPPIAISELTSKNKEKFITWLNSTVDHIVTQEAVKGPNCKYCPYKTTCWSEHGWATRAKKGAQTSIVTV